MLGRIFPGYDVERLDKLGRAFAFDMMRRHLRAEAVDASLAPDSGAPAGDRLGFLGVYVRPIAERMRFDAVLARELEVGIDGRLTGRLVARTSAGREGTSTRRVARRGTGVVWA